MSFYSIIEDDLELPKKYPLIQLIFKNWVSFISILYVLLFFIVGLVYACNQDNKDFRYMHEHEELEGNDVEYDEQISLVSLAFKRKVFFMDFCDENSLLNLFRIYLLLLHPLFSIKNRMDPHTPRFHRFLLLFTRINLSLLLSFFLLRYHPNPDVDLSSLGGLLAFILLGGFLFYLPLPAFLFSPFRSKYYLLKIKGDVPDQQAQGVEIDAEGSNNGSLRDFDQNNIEARISDVEIDAGIPIKLIFLLNALPIDKIVKETEKVGYCLGGAEQVGAKLLELDTEWAALKEAKGKA
jgi:hypothetical protein